MKEVWKSTEFANYEVSNLGRIRNITTGKLRKPQHRSGYVIVNIKKKTVSLHRAVAIAFLANPDGKTQVNHLDGNKDNNTVGNLEWTTQSENIRHGHATGLYDKRFNRRRLSDSFITDLMKEYEPGVKGKSIKALSKKYELSEGTLRGRIHKRIKDITEGKPYQPTLELL